MMPIDKQNLGSLLFNLGLGDQKTALLKKIPQKEGGVQDSFSDLQQYMILRTLCEWAQNGCGQDNIVRFFDKKRFQEEWEAEEKTIKGDAEYQKQLERYIEGQRRIDQTVHHLDDQEDFESDEDKQFETNEKRSTLDEKRENLTKTFKQLTGKYESKKQEFWKNIFRNQWETTKELLSQALNKRRMTEFKVIGYEQKPDEDIYAKQQTQNGGGGVVMRRSGSSRISFRKVKSMIASCTSQS